MKTKKEKKERAEKGPVLVNKNTFSIKFTASADQMTVIIQEKKQPKKQVYKASFTLDALYNISDFFKSFDTVEEAVDGMEMQIDAGFYEIRKEERGVILFFLCFGKTVSLNIPSDTADTKIDLASDKMAQLNKKMLRQQTALLNITKKFKKVNSAVLQMHEQEIKHNTEKENLVKYLKGIMRETLIKMRNDDKEESRKKHFQLKVAKVQKFSVLGSKKVAPQVVFLSFDPTKASVVKAINEHTATVKSLAILNDGRIASCSADKTIKIYSPKTYQCELTIIGHTEQVTYISVLSNGYLSSSSWDSTIKIWDVHKDSYHLVQTLSGHSNYVSKVIQLSNNRIGSCSYDDTIKIWDSNVNYVCMRTLKGHSNWIYSIIELKSKKYIVSGGEDKTIRFWNSSSYQCERIFEGIDCYGNNCMIEIENGKVVCGGRQVSIINVPGMQIEKQIKFDGMNYIWSLLEIGKGIVLCGTLLFDSWSFMVVDTRSYQMINSAKAVHTNYIYGLLRLDHSTVASCSADGFIKVWKS